MIDRVLEHLGHLHELRSEWDAQSDRANQVAALVESYLAENLNLGVGAGVEIDGYEDEYGPHWKQYLSFGRLADGKFRLSIKFVSFDEPNPRTGDFDQEVTAWSSCPRDLRLKAYRHIPALLAQLSANLGERIQELSSSTEAIERLVEFASSAKKGGKK